jgi:predicted kinase
MTQLRLYLMVGYPGAGKTTVAQWIAKGTGAAHLWADVERHQMFNQPSHSQTESRELYDKLNRQVEQLLANGRSVIFDTSFNYYRDRQLLRDIAERHQAETIVIWLATPLETAQARAVHANVVRNGYDFAMTAKQFGVIADKLEAPHENEKVIKIDGTKLDAETVMRLLSA